MRRVLYDLNKYDPQLTQPTTIAIPIGWKNEVVQNYWNWREIIGLGIKSKKENPQFIERIRELEESNKRLVTKLSQLSTKIYELGGDPNA